MLIQDITSTDGYSSKKRSSLSVVPVLKNKLTIALSGVLLSLSGCMGLGIGTAAVTTAAATTVPEWVSKIEQEYPRAIFLTGVASADSIEMARQRAIAVLSQNLKVQVRSNLQTSSEQSVSSNAAGRSTTTQSQSVRDDTRLTSELELPGAEIARMDLDKTTGQHYALAVVAKSKVASFWREKLKTHTAQAREALAKGQKSLGAEPLQSYQLGRRAQQSLAKALDYQQNLVLVGGSAKPNGQDDEALVSRSKLELDRLLDDAKSQMQIQLLPEAQPAGALRTALLEALGQQGLRVAGATADNAKGAKTYRMAYTLREQAPIRRDEFWWLMAEAQIELLQGTDSLGRISLPIRASAANQALLSQNLQKRLREAITSKLPTLLCSDCPEDGTDN